MVHFILGTEAELIKMFPIMLVLRKRKADYNLIGTGQHDLRKSEVLGIFGLKKPDFMLSENNLFTSIAKMFFWFFRMLMKYRNKKYDIFKGDKNGVVFVHGDALSTLLGALIAKSRGLKVAHVEAGVRSGNIFAPFPEEITRRIVSAVADLHFCPGPEYLKNLAMYKKSVRVDIRFNTALDAIANIRPKFGSIQLEGLKKLPAKYFIFIMHRTENLLDGNMVKSVIGALNRMTDKMKAVFITHHTTEHTLKNLGIYGSVRDNKNITVIPRQSFSKFMKILWKAEFIASDGGGNQQECSYIGIPNLIMRKVIEGKEGLGRNAVLSKLDLGTIENFFNNYKKYRVKPNDFKYSPSRTVVETLAKQKLI
jgi:UDP-N-acetylglucosamine 2-epimerase (non-hydrolysing)